MHVARIAGFGRGRGLHLPCTEAKLDVQHYIPLSLSRITQRAISHYLLKNILVINIFKNNYLQEEKDKQQLSSKL